METDFDISKYTSFKIGGKVKKVYFPKSVSEFVEILEKEPDAKVFGNLSNTLVSSKGYDGVIILTNGLSDIKIVGTKVYCECGVKGPMLSQKAAEQGLSGFEFMIGFPGSVGGNICMNASAHGQSISDKLLSVKCYDGKCVKDYTKEEMAFSYRHSVCAEKNIIVLSAEFELEKADKDVIKRKMEENLEFRKTRQPSLVLPNCGSIFKNPDGDSAGRLLDSVGAKTFSAGGARVWEHHANFIVNASNATSEDVLNLMIKMSDEVETRCGIKLQPEIKYLGNDDKEDLLCRKLKIK